MKTPKIVIKNDVLKKLGKTESEVCKIIEDAIRLAEKMAKRGRDRIAKTLKPKSRKNKKDAWKNDNLIGTYFSDSKLTVSAMKSVHRRLDRAHRRLSDKRLTVRVFPQSRAPSSTTNAQNLGSVFSPKTFKVFENWFKKDPDDRAAIIIHELNHDLFIDQKVVNENGKKVTVYGDSLAKLLAKKKPGKARKSAENYEQFCLRV